MKTQWILIPIGMLLLAGCQTSSDPNEGGLFGGIKGLMDDSYEGRLREREERLQAEQRAGDAMQVESRQLAAKKRAAQQALERERARLNQLTADTRALEQQIGTLAADDQRSSSETAALQQRLAQLKRDLKSHSRSLNDLEGSSDGSSANDLRRSQLEAQRRQLQQEYEALLELTLQLAQ